MRTIGLRELRQHASRYLRQVQRGETIEVTDRGHPVARIVPVPVADGVEGLAASGRLVLAADDALDLGPPLKPAAGEPLPSKALGEARADER
jgi:prevent-host-death family protein